MKEPTFRVIEAGCITKTSYQFSQFEAIANNGERAVTEFGYNGCDYAEQCKNIAQELCNRLNWTGELRAVQKLKGRTLFVLDTTESSPSKTETKWNTDKSTHEIYTNEWRLWRSPGYLVCDPFNSGKTKELAGYPYQLYRRADSHAAHLSEQEVNKTFKYLFLNTERSDRRISKHGSLIQKRTECRVGSKLG